MIGLEKQIKNIFTKSDKSDWKTFKFEDIAFNISERVEPSQTNAEIYVGLEHLDSDSIHIKKYGVPTDVKGTKLKVYKGDIIFGKRRAYQRKAGIADFDGICSAHAMVLRANPEVIDPRFFPFFIHSNTFMTRALEVSEGSLSPTIKWNTLKKQEFDLPSLVIQKNISELLWKLENLIEKNIALENKTNVLFETLIQSLTGKEYCEKNILLKDLVDLNYGKGLRESLRVQNGKFDVVSSAGVVGKHDQYIVEGPGLVIGRKGGVGNIIYVENNFWPIDTAYWVLKKDNEMNLKLLYYLLKSVHLEKLTISTAIPGINRDDILSLKICLPSKKRMEWLENSIQKTELFLDKYRNNISSLNKLKTGIVELII